MLKKKHKKTKNKNKNKVKSLKPETNGDNRFSRSKLLIKSIDQNGSKLCASILLCSCQTEKQKYDRYNRGEAAKQNCLSPLLSVSCEAFDSYGYYT